MQKLIQSITALCILLNAAVPFSPALYAASTPVSLPSESSATRFNCESTLPVTAVSEVVAGQFPLAEEFRLPERSSPEKPSPLAPVAIRPAGVSSSLFSNPVRVPAFGRALNYLRVSSQDKAPPGQDADGPPGAVAAALLLLSYLVVLSRRNLPWAFRATVAFRSTRPTFRPGFSFEGAVS